jgi:hypothetical protein
MRKLPALCCLCGNQRTVKYGGPRSYRPPAFIGEPGKECAQDRFVAELRCEACGRRTRHALLRADGDEMSTYAEELNGKPQFTHDEDIQVLIGTHIERLAEKAIYVKIAADWKPWEPGHRACITQYLNTGNWKVSINETHSPATQLHYILESEKWINTSNSTRWSVQPETATDFPKRWLWLTAAGVE